MTNSQIYKLIEKRISNTDYVKEHNYTVKLSLDFAYKGVRAILAVGFYDTNNKLISVNSIAIVNKKIKSAFRIVAIKRYSSLNAWQQYVIEKYNLNVCGKSIPIEELNIPTDIEHLIVYELIKAFKDSNLGLSLSPSNTLIINENESYEQLSIEADLMFYD